MDVINVVHLFTFYSAIWENEGSTAKGKCAYFGTSVPESHPTSRDTADCEGLVHSTRRPFLNHKTQLEKRFGRHFDLCFSFLDQLKLSNILDVDETCFFLYIPNHNGSFFLHRRLEKEAYFAFRFLSS